VLGLSCSYIIIRLLIKKKIGERISLLWLMGSLLILVISAKPIILDRLSSLSGIEYPPSLLFLLSSLILFLLCFSHSIQISSLNSQIRELTQKVVIIEAEYNRLTELNFKEIAVTQDISPKEDMIPNDLV
jgi:hypothetical protein